MNSEDKYVLPIQLYRHIMIMEKRKNIYYTYTFIIKPYYLGILKEGLSSVLF